MIELKDLQQMKKNGEKIASLTAYDASFAKLFDQANIDIILIGDSLGMVVQGAENTLSVTMTDMCYHSRLVAKNTNNAYLIADMPYLSDKTKQQAIDNSKRLIDCGVAMVKIEGAAEPKIIEAIANQGISVCGHLGLQPQSVLKLGGYKVQGTDIKTAQVIQDQATLLTNCGIELLVLECIPSQLAKTISLALDIPTIGIGAGVYCDGQILVSYDMLGITFGKTPKFVKNFLKQSASLEKAVQDYIKAVKTLSFPEISHSF